MALARACWLGLCAALLAAAAAPLTIVDATIRQMEDGAPLPAGFTYASGEVLFFSFQVAGYQAADDKIHLGYQVDAFDPKGIRIMEPIRGAVEATLAAEDKEWKPKVHHEISIPTLAGSGTYKIVAQVTDNLAKTTATKESPFEVRGHEVAPSDTLVVRNFHFYRGEDDPTPLADAAYRPGDAVWARFDIIGYKFGEGNKVDVNYGIAVLNAAGKVLFTQDPAAVEQSAAFYPKRYVPGSMNLSLQANIRAGDYFIAVTARDLIGDQKFETKERFSVVQ
jgi:hypothetical protein